MQKTKTLRKGQIIAICGAVAVLCLVVAFCFVRILNKPAAGAQGAEITLLLDGKAQAAVAYRQETVGQFLQRLDETMEGRYETAMDLDTQVAPGMQIPVYWMLEREETYTAELIFGVVYVEDPTLPEGEQKVLADGKTGLASRKVRVIYRNSRELSRELLEETVVQAPVDQVIAVGTGEQVGSQRVMPLIGDGVIVTAEGEVLYFTHTEKFVATAYTKTDPGCDDITSTGTQVRVGVVAVDPKLIPYGTRMFIITDDGEYVYGIATAEDCGGSIKNYRLDLYFDTDPECQAFGIRDCTAYFLGHVGVGYYK